jgi:hypothetical protein
MVFYNQNDNKTSSNIFLQTHFLLTKKLAEITRIYNIILEENIDINMMQKK